MQILNYDQKSINSWQMTKQQSAFDAPHERVWHYFNHSTFVAFIRMHYATYGSSQKNFLGEVIDHKSWLASHPWIQIFHRLRRIEQTFLHPIFYLFHWVDIMSVDWGSSYTCSLTPKNFHHKIPSDRREHRKQISRHQRSASCTDRVSRWWNIPYTFSST